MEWYWILILVFGCTYVTLAVILFVFPVCKLKNPIIVRKGDSRFVLGAHRGGSMERLENSLPAFKHSKELGMHIFEMDVRLTKDGQVVVHHDHSLERLTNVEVAVEDVDYADIPLASSEVPMHFGGGDIKYRLQSEDDARIPLLRDVFKDYPDVPMNIDLKGGSDELVNKVYELIVEYQREDITYWGDMNEERNKMIKQKGLSRGIRTFSSIKYTFLLCLYYYLGILQFIPLRHHSLWFPFFGRTKTRSLAQRMGNKCKHRCAICIYDCLTYCMKPMFWHLRRRGMFVMFWNIDYREEFRAACKYSIDGMITDCPTKLKMWSDEIGNGPTDTDSQFIPMNHN